MSHNWNLFTISILLITSSSNFAISQTLDFPIANLSTTWINSVSAIHSVEYTEDPFHAIIRIILLRDRQINGLIRVGLGFYCNGDCQDYLLAIFHVQTTQNGEIIAGYSPEIVWSANRNNAVKINATLQLTGEGDLVLRETDGTLAWSTNTSKMSVSGLNLTETGNLVLFNENNDMVWQSFDHPTDAWLPGQKLMAGQSLKASVSSSNLSEGGLYSLTMTDDGLMAYIYSDHDPPLSYYTGLAEQSFQGNRTENETSYAVFGDGEIRVYAASFDLDNADVYLGIPKSTSAQFIRLDPDGHLRAYDWGARMNEVYDIIPTVKGVCGFPMVCGKYGVCSSNGQCSCPDSSYFKAVNERRLDLGCSEINPVTCDNATHIHILLDLKDVTYFGFTPQINGTDVNGCKEACLRNCSCKAAILRYDYDVSDGRGDCFLSSEVLSIIRKDETTSGYNYWNSSVSIKVPMSKRDTSQVVDDRKKNNKFLGPVLGSTIGTSFLVVVICVIVFLVRRKHTVDGEEDGLEFVSGMPTKFSYEDLVIATQNFSKKLGEGGFGSVFEGSLKDGTKIAVKCLEGIGHIKKSFIAEVETIGSIHHVNLVRLIGFCTKKSQRLLVYEYLCNGSLDRWIYYRGESERPLLDWTCRRKIILDIAKGLTYLHEECRHKIIHLDIKPQNILLDEHFNARVADFGLSKLIDKNQHEVVTTMRGTPGYLAPEWPSAIITEKVDVYSFGVVVLEILCGRKNFDQSQPEEQMHLLSLFKKKADEEKWLDITDLKLRQNVKSIDVIDSELVEMMQLAAWCLQNDYSKRPSMSMVVKVLECVERVPRDNLDYNFLIPHILSNRTPEVGSEFEDVTSVLPSVLSIPR